MLDYISALLLVKKLKPAGCPHTPVSRCKVSGVAWLETIPSWHLLAWFSWVLWGERAGRAPSHQARLGAHCRLSSVVVRRLHHTDALSNTVAFILHLVNSSSSRDSQQWKCSVCHMSCLSWSSWQVRLGAETSLLFISRSVSRMWLSLSLFFHFCLITFDFLSGLSQWPSDLVPHFNKFFSSLHASLPACVSPFHTGCITLGVNVFLITCFYCKPQFPVEPPHLWVWPDWAPTSVHRAEQRPRPLRRSIITTMVMVYSKPLSR